MIIDTLHIIAAAATLLTGLIALLRPASITTFTGLLPQGGRGLTEIRAVFGGFFISLGAVPIVLKDPTGFLILGITYLFVGLVRGIFIFIDHSRTQSNWISLIVEVILGLILIL